TAPRSCKSNRDRAALRDPLLCRRSSHSSLARSLRSQMTRAPLRGTSDKRSNRSTTGSVCLHRAIALALRDPTDTTQPDCARVEEGTDWSRRSIDLCADVESLLSPLSWLREVTIAVGRRVFPGW